MTRHCTTHPARRRPALLGALATAGLLAGCTINSDTSADTGAGTRGASTGGQRAPAAAAPMTPSTTASPTPSRGHRAGHPSSGTDEGATRAGLPSAHVHGVAVNPADDKVYLATHDGLFRYDDGGPKRVGPVIDLMGFTVAGPDRFYASGHPGPGTDLPQPVGLIESTDAGQTWTPRSRQGQSDFHALAASTAGVVGFDGTGLRATGDGTTWRELDPPVSPYALAASPDGRVLLATSRSGPIRSTDAGATWTHVEGAPLLQVVDWADGTGNGDAGGSTVVGVTPDGAVAVSTDAGATWTPRGNAGGPPQALGASTAPDGSVRVLVVTGDTIQDSHDRGSSFARLAILARGAEGQ